MYLINKLQILGNHALMIYSYFGLGAAQMTKHMALGEKFGKNRIFIFSSAKQGCIF